MDLRTLGADPDSFIEAVQILRRPEVTPLLLVHRGDDADVAARWMAALETDELHTIGYTDRESSGRIADSLEFWVRTTKGGEAVASRRCGFFDVYALLDENESTVGGLTQDERWRTAALASTALRLGIDALVSTASTVGRSDVADNDLVAMIRPEELHAIFGHYLRMTGNLIVKHTREGMGTEIERAPSVADLYHYGIDSYLPCLSLVQLTARLQGDAAVVSEVHSVFTRLRRAARAVDEVLAALSRTNGQGAPTVDTVEHVSEAFDRELLYLTAAFDTYGRLFRRLLDPGDNLRNGARSLHSKKLIDDYIEPNYPDHPALDAVRALQPYAFTCATLRNRIHESVLPTGAYLTRSYGGASTVAIDLSEIDKLELDQDHVDRLGVWMSTPPNALLAPSRPVSDMATTAIGLLTAGLEYIDAFSRLILCTPPAAAPRANGLLGAAPATPEEQIPRSPEEQFYRDFFGWDSAFRISGTDE
ncbi:hypothetical protein [Rhodococcus wratislaviensis]|uniref:hypothetical protein n=1 Tax=Rhodococcus wratislaviensis TaxID=44752 RepID=UPI0035154506